MSSIVNESLRKIAKGTGIVFSGLIVGALLDFICRLLIARSFTQYEYGLFSLGFALVNVFALISLLGLQQGATRQIAYYRGKNDLSKIRSVTFSSIQIVLLASISSSIVLFITSNFLSTNVFHNAVSSALIRILSLSIPFFALTAILTSIFRGFGQVTQQAYFQNMLRRTLFLLFLLPIIFFHLPFLNAIYAFTASSMITCTVLVIYTISKYPLPKKEGSNVTAPVRKELLSLSIPLLAATILRTIISWTDTLMLGYFRTPEVVGLYNGASPLAQLIPFTLVSMGFIYVPIASQLYSRSQMPEMRRIYKILTKWIFSVSFPIFLILFLFPETVLDSFFGTNYIRAGLALRILAVGFMFHSFVGMNGLSLTVIGKSRLVMYGSLIGASGNVILNIVLIPRWGIEGAAIASATSYMLFNIFNSVALFRHAHIHPFTYNYIKPVLISLVLLISIYGISQCLKINLWMLPLLLITFLASYVFLLLLTRSFDKEDIMTFSAIEKRTGIHVTLLKRVIKKFL